MTNGTSLPKKETLESIVSDVRKEQSNADKKIRKDLEKIYKANGVKYVGSKKASHNKRNANGTILENKVSSKIKSLAGFKSTQQYSVLYTPNQSAIARRKKSIVVDELITCLDSNKTLIAEVKFQTEDGTAFEKLYKNIYLFDKFKIQCLFIVSGDFYTKEFIDDMNYSFEAAGSLKYLYMIHADNLEEFLNMWKIQPETDFVSIYSKMSCNVQ